MGVRKKEGRKERKEQITARGHSVDVEVKSIQSNQIKSNQIHLVSFRFVPVRIVSFCAGAYCCVWFHLHFVYISFRISFSSRSSLFRLLLLHSFLELTVLRVT